MTAYRHRGPHEVRADHGAAGRARAVARARPLGAARRGGRRWPCRGCGRGCRPTRRATLALVAGAAAARPRWSCSSRTAGCRSRPAAGALVTPAYVGRPAVAAPLRGRPAPPARPGRRPTPAPGRARSGESPRVDTAWFGAESCGPAGVVRAGPAGRAVHGPARPAAAGDRPRDPAPAGPQGAARRAPTAAPVSGCGAEAFYLDERRPRRRGDHRPAACSWWRPPTPRGTPT